MQTEDAKRVAGYYKHVQQMLRLLRGERKDLEDDYYSLNVVAADGMPRGSSPGKPTEAKGLLAIQEGVGDRLREIATKEKQLMKDEASIRACLNAINARYKQVIIMRHVHKYSWAKISVTTGTPDSTVRHWYRKALERFGEALEEVPGVGELVERASRART